MRSTVPFLALLLCAGCCVGCRSYREVEDVLVSYEAGDLDGAADQICSERYDALRDGDRDGVLVLLEQGKILHDVGRFEESEATFQEADRRIRDYDEKPEYSITGEIGGILTNQESRDYRGREWEKILLETYRSMNSLALGDFQEAMVFTRRAGIRQDQAVAANEKAIEAAREGADSQGHDADAVLSQESVEAQVRDLRTRVNPAYADYTNPYTSFLNALLLWIDGDAANAEVDMRKALAMVPENAYAAELFDQLEARAPPAPPQGRVYVLFENGMAPFLAEVGIQIITRNGYSALLLPTLRFIQPPVATLRLETSDARLAFDTAHVADVESIVSTDFLARYPGIVLRTLLSVTVKEIATNQIRGQDQNWGFLIGSIWKAATAGADLRTWRTVGSEFQIAFCERPADGILDLTLIDFNGGRHLTTRVELPPTRFTILMARSPNLRSFRVHAVPLGPVVAGPAMGEESPAAEPGAASPGPEDSDNSQEPERIQE